MYEGGEGLESRKTVTSKVDYLIGEFFGDYEREVDKFKPWKCYFNVTIRVNVKELQKLIAGEITHFNCDDTIATLGSLRDIIDKFIFIKNEPELAFCQCWCSLNYNETHVTRAYARKEYKKYLEYKNKKQEEENDALKVQFEYFKQLLDAYGFEQFSDYVVVDRNYGDDITTIPRFELILKVQKEWLEVLEDPNQYGYYGVYNLSDILSSDDKSSRKLYNDYRKFEKNTKKKYKYVYLLDDIDFFGIITSAKRFSKEKKKDGVIDISTPEKYYSNEVYE